MINCYASPGLLSLKKSGLKRFLTDDLFIPFRIVFLRKRQTTQLCVSSGVVLFEFMTAMVAADDGISPSMVPSALLQRRLTVWSTWYTEMEERKIYTACGKSKACVRKSTRAQYAWDFGSVTVQVTDLLTPTQGGTQCPGSTWKKYHPHRLEKADYKAFFVGGLELILRRFIVTSN